MKRWRLILSDVEESFELDAEDVETRNGPVTIELNDDQRTELARALANSYAGAAGRFAGSLVNAVLKERAARR